MRAVALAELARLRIPNRAIFDHVNLGTTATNFRPNCGADFQPLVPSAASRGGLSLFLTGLTPADANG